MVVELNGRQISVNSQAMQMLGDEAEQNFKTLDRSDIEKIHDLMIEMFGGSYGVRDAGLLESACLSPYQNVFGQNLYPTILDKAAKYAFDFANYQIFIDGNKRTGLATMTAFLDINGYELNMSSEQQYFLMMDIANKRIDDPQTVSEILKQHVKFAEMEAEMEPER